VAPSDPGSLHLNPCGTRSPVLVRTGRPRHMSEASPRMATMTGTMEAHRFENRAVRYSREARRVPRPTKLGNSSTPRTPNLGWVAADRRGQPAERGRTLCVRNRAGLRPRGRRIDSVRFRTRSPCGLAGRPPRGAGASRRPAPSGRTPLPAASFGYPQRARAGRPACRQPGGSHGPKRAGR
jgi:hypothetical protein